MLRRTGIGTSPCLGKNCCQQIALWMGKIQGWDRQRIDREIQEYPNESCIGAAVSDKVAHDFNLLRGVHHTVILRVQFPIRPADPGRDRDTRE